MLYFKIFDFNLYAFFLKFQFINLFIKIKYIKWIIQKEKIIFQYI